MESSKNYDHYDYKESALPEDKQKKLNELRKIQVAGEFTPTELNDFKKLSEEEKKSQKGLNYEEKQEYLLLTKKQTRSVDWTPKNAERLQELQRRLDA